MCCERCGFWGAGQREKQRETKERRKGAESVRRGGKDRQQGKVEEGEREIEERETEKNIERERWRNIETKGHTKTVSGDI